MYSYYHVLPRKWKLSLYKVTLPCFHLPSTLLEGVLQCLVLCLCGNQWLLLAASAAVSCVHLWPPSSISHGNTLIPVWTHDTNEIGMWKWGSVLWHWVTAGAGSRVQLWGLSLCSVAVGALPTLRGYKAHVREDGNSAGECSTEGLCAGFSAVGEFLQFRAVIYDEDVLQWYWLSQQLPCVVPRSGYLCCWHAVLLWEAVS